MKGLGLGLVVGGWMIAVGGLVTSEAMAVRLGAALDWCRVPKGRASLRAPWAAARVDGATGAADCSSTGPSRESR